MWNDDTLNGGTSLENNNDTQDLNNVTPDETISAETAETNFSEPAPDAFEEENCTQQIPEEPETNFSEAICQAEPVTAAYQTTDYSSDYNNSSDTDASVKEEKPEEKTVYASYHISESEPPRNEKPKKEKKKGMNFVAKALVAGLIFGIVAFGTVYAASQLFPFKTQNTVVEKTTTQTTTPLSTNSDTVSEDYEVAQVVREVMPAVVTINCTGTTVYNSFFGQQEYPTSSAGTGIIVGSNDAELLIATNNHVVTNSETIEIIFDDESTATAALKGSSSDVDLAVVAVKWDDLSEETKSAIKIATLGDSSSLIVGEPAIAIGNSLGYGQSVTSGIISALNREVTVTTDDSYGYGNSQEVTSELIQTDAAINPGNSGGPLLNSKGEVIGINSVKYSSEEVEGMGYAIPISEALPILEDLMSRETKVKVDEDEQSYLGITGTNVTSDAAMIYGMPSGVFVAQLVEDGPAENGGMKRGDIITEVDGTSISSLDELTEELLYHKAGSTVEVIVNRNSDGEYKEITLEITLGSKADAPSEEELNTDEIFAN